MFGSALIDAIQAATGPACSPLLPQPQLDHAGTVLDSLPPIYEAIGFECRLRDDDERVDIGLAVTRRHATSLATSLAPRTERSIAAELIREWARDSCDLHRCVPHVWIELDLPARDTLAWFPFLAIAEDTPRARAAELLDRVPHHGRAALRRCIHGLPTSARVCHLAASDHRGATQSRVHVRMARQDLLGWLERIEWPGDHRPVDAWIRGPLLASFPVLYVQLTANTQLEPELGIELYRPCEHDWPRLFELLTAVGLCVPSRAAAALAWPGRDQHDRGVGKLPIGLRRDFHVKLGLRPDRAPEAKIYLFCRWHYNLI